MKNASCICAITALLTFTGCEDDDECNKDAILHINNFTDCEIGVRLYDGTDGMVLDDIIVGSHQTDEAFVVIPLQHLPGDFTVRIFGNTEDPCLLTEKFFRRKIATGCSEYAPIDVRE